MTLNWQLTCKQKNEKLCASWLYRNISCHFIRRRVWNQSPDDLMSPSTSNDKNEKASVCCLHCKPCPKTTLLQSAGYCTSSKWTKVVERTGLWNYEHFHLVVKCLIVELSWVVEFYRTWCSIQKGILTGVWRYPVPSKQARRQRYFSHRRSEQFWQKK